MLRCRTSTNIMAIVNNMFVPSVILMHVLLVYRSYAKEVVLANGRIELRPVSASDVLSEAVQANEEAAYDAAAKLSAGAADSVVWGAVRTRRMFVMSYRDAAHAKRITAKLAARQAVVLSYIPKQNLLVSAGRDVALRVAWELDAELAEFDWSFKLSPDWQPLIAPQGPRTASADPGSSAGPVDRLPSDVERHAEAMIAAMRILGSDVEAALPRYGVLVELQPGLPAAALTAAEAAWPGALTAATGSPRGPARRGGACKPVVETPSLEGQTEPATALRLSVYLCRQDLVAGLRWLAALPEVRWVAPLLGARADNALSSILIQTGGLSEEQYVNSTTSDSAPSFRPFWAAGLQGQGEIVGVGDTGLEVDMCYFNDPRYTGQYRAALANVNSLPQLQGLPFARIAGHRKVVQYALMSAGQFMSDGIDVSGHGTSVSGCVAGAVLAGDDPWGDTLLDAATGAAPAARISLVDLSNDTNGSMVLPLNIADNYLAVHKAAGAIIHSNSWGWPLETYTSTYTYSQDFDSFLWRNPSALSVNSAGNDGTKVVRRPSINQPSLAKNVMAVGAGTRMSSELQGLRYDNYKLVITWKSGQVEEMMFFPLENRRLPLLVDMIPADGKLRMILADPLAACKSLRRLRLNPRGAVVLAISPTQCNTYTQVRRVVDAGGSGLLVMLPSPNSAKPTDPLDPETGELFTLLPVSYVNAEWGTFLTNLLANDSLAELAVTWVQQTLDNNSILPFSSAGPLQDGRIKPDIIAPGYGITSAGRFNPVAAAAARNSTNRSADSCRVVDDLAGTSFAAPLVAGHATIMRQYFRTGFYPGGSPTGELRAPFAPSGILLKAAIIAGAASMEGGTAMLKVGPLGPSPDGFQGWGRMDLSGSLPLEGVTDPRVRLQLVDWGTFTSEGASAVLEGLTATGTGPITVVLTYYDYPGEVATNGALVNDLDLRVALIGGGGGGGGAGGGGSGAEAGPGPGESAAPPPAMSEVLGNNDEGADTPRPDPVNTVERVLLRSPAAGTALRITVTARSLPSVLVDPLTPQRWALVAVGHFTGTLISPFNPAWVLQENLAMPPSRPQTPPPSPPGAPPPLPRLVRPTRKRPPPPQLFTP